MSARIGNCHGCGAALAHDQRYCIECGWRRSADPGPLLALMHRGSPASAPPRRSSRTPGFTLPSPRAAAVAVCALLGFGVVVGSLVSPAAESAAQTPLVVAVRPSAPTPSPAPEPAADDTAIAADDTPDVSARAPVQAPAPAPAPAPVPQPAPESASPAPTAKPHKPLPVPPLPALPSVSHVFMIVLSGHGYDAAFGPNSAAPYLSEVLTAQGELMPNYYAIAHGGLSNEIALASGQGPTIQTSSDCPQYADVTPGTIGAQGQAQGDGCVYPTEVKTVADQLFAGGDTWKAYVEDLAKGPGGCNHPALGGADPDHDPRPDDAHVTWRNPFLYFHSLIDSPACGSAMADLSQLRTDLEQVGDTPALSYIVPDRCHDGSDSNCAPKSPAGLAAADAWLQTIVPSIEASAGYEQGGLIAITFDSAPSDGPEADSDSCCGQPPNEGGGKVGLLLISPYIKPGTVNTTGSYNHYSLLASIEDLFSLDRLGYAGMDGLPAFDKTVYSAYNAGP